MDLERDILAHMVFRPHVTTNLRLMDERLFGPQPMGIIESFRTRSRPLHSRLSDFELSRRPWRGASRAR